MTPKANPDKEQLRLEYNFDHGVNFKDRVIRITGQIEDGESFDWLDSAMSELERGSKKAITIRINSPGGNMYEALAMLGRIERSKCHTITECYGHAMSAASLLLAGGKKRRMSRRAWLMTHEISYGLHGTHAEVKEQVAQAEREMKAWAEAMSEFSSEDAEFWIKVAKKQDYYLNADQCLQYGIIDEIF